MSAFGSKQEANFPAVSKKFPVSRESLRSRGATHTGAGASFSCLRLDAFIPNAYLSVIPNICLRFVRKPQTALGRKSLWRNHDRLAHVRFTPQKRTSFPPL